MDMNGSKVVVIGGSSGIGLATAQAAMAEGADVVICARSAERLRAAAAGLGGSVEAVALDIGDEAAVAALFARVDRLDHVFITAGSFPEMGPGGPDPRKLNPIEALRPVVQSRLYGPIHVVRHATPKIRPGGSITFTTGVATIRPLPGESFMSATGGGVEALSRGLAVDMAPVRFNVIRPGLIDTPLLDRFMGPQREQIVAMAVARFPAKRAGRPEEIAAAALFLMKNEYVTGIELTVDGGSHIA
jgi:NAD(P)-dependent dehydrogenase (short-subunit alcohol dehydrogenase family)